MASPNTDAAAGARGPRTVGPHEAPLHEFLDRDAAIVLVTTTDGVILFANGPSEASLGYAPAELDGKSVFTFVHAEDLPALQEAFESALARPGEPGPSVAIRCVRGDDSWRSLEASARCLAGPPREGIVAISIVDTASRAQRAQALHHLLERLELTEETGRTGHFWWDVVNDITYWSPEIMRLYGLPADAFQGGFGDWLDRVHPEDRAEAGRAARQSLTDGYFEHAFRVVWPDGSTHWLRSRAEVYYADDGKPLRLVGVNVDITESRRVEEERSRLAMAVEQAGESIMITDPAGIISYVNPAFERASGYRREEALGRNPRILKSGKQDAHFYRRMWDTLLSGEQWSGHFTNRRKDGSLYEEDAVISPVRAASGSVVSFVAIKRDVTEQRSLASQLLHSQKMEAVGRLASGVAHDFNNLLTVIMGHAHLLRSKLSDDEQCLADVDEVLKAATRAASLTRQLLIFSRKQTQDVRVFDLNSVIMDTEKMLQRLIGEDVELAVVLAGGAGSIRADQGQIEQVLMNLVVNARDAMPTGGRLTIETAGVELDEGYTRGHLEANTGPHVLLRVTDTGTGMTPEVRARIFEPFFTTKEGNKGTGLGLATVHGIVKQSGGFIEVRTEPGAGTSFEIYLPRVAEMRRGTRSGRDAAKPDGGTETVLLVEDEAAIRRILSESLARLGYTVIEATDVEDALRQGEDRARPFHLLLTDVVMPIMSGADLAQRLASGRPDLRVLFMSGYADSERLRAELRAGAAEFIQKPFTPQQLARKVRECLDAPRSQAA